MNLDFIANMIINWKAQSKQ